MTTWVKAKDPKGWVCDCCGRCGEEHDGCAAPLPMYHRGPDEALCTACYPFRHDHVSVDGERWDVL